MKTGSYEDLMAKRLHVGDGDDHPTKTTNDEEIGGTHEEFEYIILKETKTVQWSNMFQFVLDLPNMLWWNYWIMFSAIAYYLLGTIIMVFVQQTNQIGLILYLVFDLWFVVDVLLRCLHFFSKTLQNRHLGGKKILWWHLVIDITSFVAIPLNLIYLWSDSIFRDRTVRYVRMIAYIRLWRINLLRMELNTVQHRRWPIMVALFFVVTCILQHGIACVWFYISCQGNFFNCDTRVTWDMAYFEGRPILKNTTWVKYYFLSNYIAIQYMANVGYGDVIPVNKFEHILCIVAMQLGQCFFTILLVAFACVITSNIKKFKINYALEVEAIQTYLKDVELPEFESKLISNYYKALWDKKMGLTKADTFSRLPLPLQMELMFDVNYTHINRCMLFHELHEHFLRAISLLMRHEFLLPGDIIFHLGVVKTKMIIIMKGVLELLSSEDDESPIISFKTGTVLGEAALFMSLPAEGTLRASVYTEIAIIDRVKFLQFMKNYPSALSFLRICVDDRIWQLKFSYQKNKNRVKNKNSFIKLLKSRANLVDQEHGIRKIKDTTENTNTSFIPLYRVSYISSNIRKPVLCITEQFPWIIDGDSPLANSILTIFFLAHLTFLLVYPYNVVFKRKISSATDLTRHLSDIACFFDILLLLTTTVRLKNAVLFSFKDIFFYRMRSPSYYIYFVPIFPYEHFFELGRARDLVMSIKLLRLARCYQIIDILQQKYVPNKLFVNYIKLLWMFAMLVYYFGSIYYLVACYNNSCDVEAWFYITILNQIGDSTSLNETWYSMPFLASTYFAASTFLRLGTGDVVPYPYLDMVIAMGLIYAGIVFKTILMSTFSTNVTISQRKKHHYKQMVWAFGEFLKVHKVNDEFRSRVKSYLFLQWEYNLGNGRDAFHETAPMHLELIALKKELGWILKRVPLFKHVNVDFLMEIARACKIQIFPPESTVYYSGDVMREMFVIQKGYCCVTGHSGKPLSILGPGHYFGDMEMQFGLSKLYTISTLTTCKLICLNFRLYSACLSAFPKELQTYETVINASEIKKDLVTVKIFMDNIDHASKLHKSKKSKRITFHQIINNTFSFPLSNISKKSYIQYWKPFKSLGKWQFVGALLMPICIRPDSVFLKIWLVFRFVTFVLFLLIAVYIFGLNPKGLHFILFVNLNFLTAYINMYLMAHIGYFNERGLLISHPRFTAQYYFSRSFFIDLVGIFPLSKVIMVFDTSHTQYIDNVVLEYYPHADVCKYRLSCFLQYIRFLEAAYYLKKDLNLYNPLLSIFCLLPLVFMFYSALSVHLITSDCWYSFQNIRESNPEKIVSEIEYIYKKNNTMMYGYLHCHKKTWFNARKLFYEPVTVVAKCVYWCMTLLFGIGTGEVTMGVLDVKLSGFIVLTGMFLQAFLLTVLSLSPGSEKAETDAITYQYKVQDLINFMKNQGSTDYTIKKTFEHLEYVWKRTGGLDKSDIMKVLNTALVEDLALCLYEEVLRKVPLFENVELCFIRVFAKHLQEQFFFKNDKLISCYDVHSTIYIIVSGQVSIYNVEGEMLATMGVGGIFGNIHGAVAACSTVSVISKKDLNVLVISSDTFFNIFKEYPEVQHSLFSILVNVGDFIQPTVIQQDIIVETFTYAEVDYEEENVDNQDQTSLDLQHSASMSYHSEQDRTSMHSVGKLSRKLSDTRSGISASQKSVSQMFKLGEKNCFFAFLLFINPRKWFRFSLLPNHSIFEWYDFTSMLCAYYQLLVIPNSMFMEVDIPSVMILSYVMDLVFYVRMFIKLHKSFLDPVQKVYIKRNRQIAHRYFHDYWEIFWDVVPNIPFFYAGLILKNSTLRIILRCWQCLRYKYFKEYFVKIKKPLMARRPVIDVVQTAMIYYLIVHYLTLIMHQMFIARLDLRAYLRDAGVWKRYVYCSYYITNILTRTGVGDIYQASRDTLVYTVIVAVLGEVFYLGILLKAIRIVTVSQQSLITYEYNVQVLTNFFANLNLSNHQMEKLWTYLKSLWTTADGYHMPELLDACPYTLKCDILFELYGDLLRNCYLFEGTSTPLIRQVCHHLKRVVFFSGNYIIQHGETNACMYWVRKGKVSVLTVHSNLTETRYEVLDTKDMFGMAQGLYTGLPHTFSYRAETNCHILMLELQSWEHIMNHFPNDKQTIYHRLHTRYLIV